jgi:hypothetical protein
MGKAIAAWSDRPDPWAERLLGENPFGDGARFAALSRALWAPLHLSLGARAPEGDA